MPNPFCHVELSTDNPEAAKSFYSDLFEWQLEDMPMGDMTYTMIGVGEGTGGGMMKNPCADAPSSWMPYIQVDNLAESTEKAKSLGGQIL